jgi:hypothetical protein
MQLINFTDTSLYNIEQVIDAHFRQRDPKNFRRNFCDCLAAFGLEVEDSGAQRCESRGKLRHLFSAFFIIYLRII